MDRRRLPGPSAVLRWAKQSVVRRLRRFIPLISAVPFLALIVFMLARSDYDPGTASLPEICQTPPKMQRLQQSFPYAVPPELEKFLLPDHNTSVPVFNSSNSTVPFRQWSVSEVSDLVRLSNAAQVIHNEDAFGPVDNATLVIVVQVHSRVEYLRHLVVSLAQAQGIEDALVIFSHDLFDAEINELVGRIDFCRFAQIFFPFSIQLHPDEFPGQDPRDCPPLLKRSEAEKLGCRNAQWPDKYGHYRQADLSQIKHHWWWKAWYLFEGGFKALEGDLIFLEEDHWVVKDLLHTYRLLKQESKMHCPECAIISLGNQVEITQWISSKHNIGMAFGRKTWNSVKGCAKQFCLFDDYNWDWSLMYIGMTCTRPNLLTLNLKSSRVFHVGECVTAVCLALTTIFEILAIGIHHKKASCDVGPVLKLVNEQVRQYANLFPESLKFRRATYKVKAPKGNGGWGDYRDRALCLNLTAGMWT
ncbi:unnamed protein product [Notodromas monacha]|uniref:Alpha-1,6-mannosyl-glycoprotein 2-beta-N-acetylglucosaminyltransferase n=1 Tax=Notodromas monacha TaxID=399045 RepID=A0A7R9GG42_9CRUS|nr:unnamed protein product [Notodromas monacha]CAG0919988.1 unnamed protein product [Notodromas monacha]